MNYHALLAHFPKITYTRYKKLFNFFSTPQAIWEAEFSDLTKTGIEETIVDEFIQWREKLDTQTILKKLEDERITTVSLGQPGYPTLLAEIADPPHTLFIRGTLPASTTPSIAIVGTRRHTPYGKHIAEEFGTALARHGLVVVSGLALGIDGIVHTAVLATNGVTIAVLGSGLDKAHVYPSFHHPLAERIIAQGGALVSEYPPGFEPTRYSFPARNRIIAGLTLGTLVIEATDDSGALITARCALDYNREVMAIPHPLTSPTGSGNHQLIKQGAVLVTTPQDVIEALHIQEAQAILTNRTILPTSPIEEKILTLLSSEPQHIDSLIKQSGLVSQTVTSTLVLMEMKGYIKNLGAMMYIRK